MSSGGNNSNHSYFQDKDLFLVFITFKESLTKEYFLGTNSFFRPEKEIFLRLEEKKKGKYDYL